MFGDRQLQFDFDGSHHWSGFVRLWKVYLARKRWREALAVLPNVSDAPHTAQRVPIGPNHAEMFVEPLSEAAEESIAQSLELLDEVNAECRKRDLPWALVLSPNVTQLSSDPAKRFDQPQARIVAWAWARERGVPCLDLRVPYLAAIGRRDYERAEQFFIDEAHPGAEGSRVAGKAIAELLLENGLIPE
jgi:hypothetical protein